MTAQIIPFRPRPKVDNYFGGCPTCGRTNGYLNAGRGHWFVCDAHQVMWFAGANLFSDWRGETEAEQRERWARIEHYREVKPIYQRGAP